MKKKPKDFWRNFTWKRFIYFVLICYIAVSGVNILIDWLTGKENVLDYFQTENLLKKFISAIFIGFFLAIWVDHRHKVGEKRH